MGRIKQRLLVWLTRVYSLVSSPRRTQPARAQPPNTQVPETQPPQAAQPATQQDRAVPQEASATVHPANNHLVSFHPPNLHRRTHIARVEPSPWYHCSLTRSNPRPQRPKPFRFLDLPTEIRLEVYSHLLPLANNSTDKDVLSLLYVSRQLHNEFAYILYTTTPLVLVTKSFDSLATALTKMGTQNSSWLRSLSWEWRFNDDLLSVKSGNYWPYLVKSERCILFAEKAGTYIVADLNLVATQCTGLRRLVLTFEPVTVQGRVAMRGADIFSLCKRVREALGKVRVVDELVVWNTWATEEVEEIARRIGVKTVGVGWGKGFTKPVKWRRRRKLRTRGWNVESVAHGPNAVLCKKDLLSTERLQPDSEKEIDDGLT